MGLAFEGELRMDGNDKSQERKVGFFCLCVVLGNPLISPRCIYLFIFFFLLMSFSMLFIVKMFVKAWFLILVGINLLNF